MPKRAPAIKTTKASELMGAYEIAEFLGVQPAVVYNWYKRGLLPLPVARLRMGPVWIRSQITPLKKHWPTDEAHGKVKRPH